MTTRLLFLCTGNSARSILAEAIANCLYGDSLSAESAGSTPKGVPNPLALETLDRHGLPTDRWQSKSWDAFEATSFDLVITLCDSAARETCPIFPGAPVHAHWGFPDPPAANDPAAAFEAVFQGLREALGAFVADADADLDTRAARVAALVQERFPEAAV